MLDKLTILKLKKFFGNANKSDRLNSLQNAATSCRKPFPSGFVTLTCPVRKVQVCKSKQGLRFNRLSHWHMMFSNFKHFSLNLTSKSQPSVIFAVLQTNYLHTIFRSYVPLRSCTCRCSFALPTSSCRTVYREPSSSRIF